MYSTSIKGFQKLLNNFQIKLDFVHLMNEIELTPDSSLYEVETKQGKYFIYETDSFTDLKDIGLKVEEYVGKAPEFIEVINPPEKLEDIRSSKFYLPGKYTYDFESIKKYINDKNGTDPSTITFLIKRK